MIEKKEAYDLAHLADGHIRITTYRWVEEDGKMIGEKTVDMEQIEQLQKDLHAYAPEVQEFAVQRWGYADLAAYDAARQALIDSQPAPEPEE